MEAGVRLAFQQAHGRAGPHAVRLVRLDSTKPRASPGIPVRCRRMQRRRATIPSAVAYIGELGLGASAISVPVTNDGGLLQVVAARVAHEPYPGAARRCRRGAPDRYYPTGRRTFLRLVPNDLRVADLITARVNTLGAERVALVTGEGVYAEELTQPARRAAAPRRAHRPADRRDGRRPEDAGHRSSSSWRSERRTRSSTPGSAIGRPCACSPRSRGRCPPRRCSRAPACSAGRRCGSAKRRRVSRRSARCAGRELRARRRARSSRRCGAPRRRVAARGALRIRGCAAGARRGAQGGGQACRRRAARQCGPARAGRRSGPSRYTDRRDVTGPPLTHATGWNVECSEWPGGPAEASLSAGGGSLSVASRPTRGLGCGAGCE